MRCTSSVYLPFIQPGFETQEPKVSQCLAKFHVLSDASNSTDIAVLKTKDRR